MNDQEPDFPTVGCSDIDKDEATRSRPTAKRLEQWSELVAQGEIPFPSDLTADEFQRLLLGVARRRRKWLVKFIADAIAQDIVRSQGTSTENTKDVEANV